MRRRGVHGTIAVAAALAIVAAACGSDSKSSSTSAGAAATTAAGASTTAAAGAATTAGGAATTAGSGSSTPAAGSSGTGSAGCRGDRQLTRRRSRHGRRPVHVRPAVRRQDAAQGRGRSDRHRLPEPRGRPERQLPRVHARAQAAVKYINEELGGLGARHPERQARPADQARGLQDGDLPGRLAALRQRAGRQEAVPRRVDDQLLRQPLPDLPGGRHPGHRQLAGHGRRLHARSRRILDRRRRRLPRRPHRRWSSTPPVDLKAKRVAVPWADTPPGVVCYYDLEKKPLDVLQGSVKGTRSWPARSPTCSTSACRSSRPRPTSRRRSPRSWTSSPTRSSSRRRARTAGTSSTASAASAGRPTRSRWSCPDACIDFDEDEGCRRPGQGHLLRRRAGGTPPTTRARSRTRSPSSRPTTFQTKAERVRHGQVRPAQGLRRQRLQQHGQHLGAERARRPGRRAADGSGVRQLRRRRRPDDHMFGSTPLSCSHRPAAVRRGVQLGHAVAKWDGTGLVPVKPTASPASTSSPAPSSSPDREMNRPVRTRRARTGRCSTRRRPRTGGIR